MKKKIKKILYTLSKGPLGPALCFLWNTLVYVQLKCLHLIWFLGGAKKPTEEQQKLICGNVTFLFKSFERQKLAKKLYRNIQHYYPGVNVIIVDDSRKPFVIRMDDDELLTPHSNFHKQLEFLLDHPEVDLVGILPMNLPVRKNWKKKNISDYEKFKMSNAPKQLIIPYGTKIDDDHIVFGKVPNIFIAGTDKYRMIGYDDNIRMIDHHEFFYRAAGNIVSVLDASCFVLHMHCPFDHSYRIYRNDITGDRRYIALKHGCHY